MTVGILPNVNVKSQNRVANSALSARSFAHRMVEEQPNKKPKKGGDRSAVALLKDVRQFGCAFQDTAAGIFSDFTDGHKNLGINSTSAIHKSYEASRRHPRKQRTIAW